MKSKKAIRFLLWWLQGERCVWCRATMPFGLCTLEHVTPRARGGSSGLQNLAVACADCNHSRGC